MSQITRVKAMGADNDRGKKGLVITIGGPHGTGKSTYARAVAKAFDLRYVCAGTLFRELARENGMTLENFSKYAAENPKFDKLIDEKTCAQARKGGVVIDAQIGAWMVKEADLKLFLVAADETRFKRIAQRENISFENARRETLAREQIQRERYKKYYAIDVADQTVYDLKIDTGLYSIEKTKKIIIEAIRNSLDKHRVSGLTR